MGTSAPNVGSQIPALPLWQRPASQKCRELTAALPNQLRAFWDPLVLPRPRLIASLQLQCEDTAAAARADNTNCCEGKEIWLKAEGRDHRDPSEDLSGQNPPPALAREPSDRPLSSFLIRENLTPALTRPKYKGSRLASSPCSVAKCLFLQPTFPRGGLASSQPWESGARRNAEPAAMGGARRRTHWEQWEAHEMLSRVFLLLAGRGEGQHVRLKPVVFNLPGSLRLQAAENCGCYLDCRSARGLCAIPQDKDNFIKQSRDTEIGI